MRPTPAALTRPPCGPPFSSSLAPTVEQKQRIFSMPVGLPSHINLSSIDSSRSDTKVVVPSPEEGADGKHKSTKRHVSSEPKDKDDNDGKDNDKLVKKTAHSLIEKRYRTNITDNFAALRDSVPSLRITSKSARGEDTTQDYEGLYGLTPARKLSKATISSKATEYICHLEKRNNRLVDENNAMRARIATVEEVFRVSRQDGQLPFTYSPVAHQLCESH